MTETRVYEPTRLSTPPKPLFSLKPLDANLVEVIVILGLPFRNKKETNWSQISQRLLGLLLTTKKKQLANS